MFRAIRRARQALRLFFKPSLAFVKNREEESAEEPSQRPTNDTDGGWIAEQP